MTLLRKSQFLACFTGVLALTLGACSAQNHRNPYQKTNHFRPQNVKAMGYYNNGQRIHAPHGMQSRGMMHPQMLKNGQHPRLARLNPRMPQFQQWVEYEPQYLIYPGDQLDIVVSSAPELSRTLTVGPDGRVVMPMTQPIMAAGRSFTQVQQMLSTQLGKQLRDPRIAVTPRAYGPQQIFVGGAVGQQGTYTLPGPIGAMEAILMAGGFTTTSKASKVAVLRRAPNGGMMMRTVNISRGMKNMQHYNDVLQLRRGDIIYVPRTNLAEVAIFVQTLRDALPVDFSVAYQLGNNNNGNPAIIP